jgi:RNA polymerase sigma-70 factor (ECF subfamily)
MSTAFADDLVRSVYREQGKALLAYVTGLTGDAHRAEDVVQEAVLRAWRHAEELRPDPAQLRAWLFRVARNITIDESRVRKARPILVEEHDQQVEDRTEEVLTAIDVRRALRRLAPTHRAILVEVYLRGRTIAEAAQSLRIPLGTAKSRLYDAVRSLRSSPLTTAA